jgi:hypothetical protein
MRRKKRKMWRQEIIPTILKQRKNKRSISQIHLKIGDLSQELLENDL